jgi:hypothetical protein
MEVRRAVGFLAMHDIGRKNPAAKMATGLYQLSDNSLFVF